MEFKRMGDFAFPHFDLYSNKHFKWQNEPVGPLVFHNINYVRNKIYGERFSSMKTVFYKVIASRS